MLRYDVLDHLLAPYPNLISGKNVNKMKNIILAISVIIASTALFYIGTPDASDQTIYEAQKKLEEPGYDSGKPDGIPDSGRTKPRI